MLYFPAVTADGGTGKITTREAVTKVRELVAKFAQDQGYTVKK